MVHPPQGFTCAFKSGYPSYHNLPLSLNKSCHSPPTSLIDEVILPAELLLTGRFFSFPTLCKFCENSRDCLYENPRRSAVSAINFWNQARSLLFLPLFCMNEQVYRCFSKYLVSVYTHTYWFSEKISVEHHVKIENIWTWPCVCVSVTYRSALFFQNVATLIRILGAGHIL